MAVPLDGLWSWVPWRLPYAGSVGRVLPLALPSWGGRHWTPHCADATTTTSNLRDWAGGLLSPSGSRVLWDGCRGWGKGLAADPSVRRGDPDRQDQPGDSCGTRGARSTENQRG